MTPRVRAVLENRWLTAQKPDAGYVWPGETSTGYIHDETVRRSHLKALKTANVRHFVLHSIRHTFLTRLSAESLQQLFLEQKDKAIRLGELILERGLVEKSELIKALEEVSRVPYLDCTDIVCELQALQAIPYDVARRLAVLPIQIEPTTLIVAMAEPQNLSVLDELRFISGKTISPRIGFLAEIVRGISRNYATINWNPATADGNGFGPAHPVESLLEMEFVSTSSRQANREAIQEIQAELNQKTRRRFVW